MRRFEGGVIEVHPKAVAPRSMKTMPTIVGYVAGGCGASVAESTKVWDEKGSFRKRLFIESMHSFKSRWS